MPCFARGPAARAYLCQSSLVAIGEPLPGRQGSRHTEDGQTRAQSAYDDVLVPRPGKNWGLRHGRRAGTARFMNRDPLARLAELRSAILALRAEAHAILSRLAGVFGKEARATAAPSGAAPKAPRAARKKSAKRGRRSHSGPLGPAVVKALQTAGRPLRVVEIFDVLKAAGYEFTGKNPKKTLGVRMYSLPGVQSMGGGLFGPDQAAGEGAAAPTGAAS